MRFVKGTIIYLKRSYWVAIPFALIPAIILALFLKPLNIVTFLPEYYTGNINGFADIFWLMAGERGWGAILRYLLIFSTLLLYFSIALAMIEKHMRTGKLTMKNLLLDLNNNILSTLVSLVFFAAIYAAVLILLSSIISLVHQLVSGAGVPKPIDCLYITLIALFAQVGFARVIIDVLFWGPIMQIYGYYFKDAVIETAHITDKNTGSLLLALIVPIFFGAVINILIYYIPFGGGAKAAVEFISNLFIYLAILIYLPAYVMSALFDIAGLERRDAKKRY